MASGSLVSRALRDYRAVVAGQAVAFVCIALYVPMVARALGPAGYAEFSVPLVTVQVLASFGFLWSQTGALRLAQAEVARTGGVSTTVAARLMLNGGLLSLLVFGMSFSPGLFAGLIGPSSGVIWGLPLLATWFVADTMIFALRATGRFSGYAWSNGARNVALVVGALGLSLGWLPAHAPTVLVLEALGFAVLAGGAVMLLPRSTWSAPVGVRTALRELLVGAWPLLGLQISGYLRNGIDVYLIAQRLDASALGAYQAAYRVMQLISQGAIGVMPVLFHTLMAAKLQARDKEIAQYVTRTVPQLSLGWAALMILASMASGVVFELAFSSAFAESLVVFRLLVVALVVQILMVLLSSVLFVYDRLGLLCALHAGILAVNGVGNWLLIPGLGIVGAAVANVGAVTVGAIGYWALASDSVKRRSGVVFVPIGVGAACALVLALTPPSLLDVGIGGGGLLALVLVSRHRRIVVEDDWRIVEELRPPESCKRLLRSIFGCLSYRPL